MLEVPLKDVKIPTLSVGDVVTFSYEINSRVDIPLNPKIYRIRSDVGWDDLVQSYSRDKHINGKITFSQLFIIIIIIIIYF
jgi:hypothetical protein